MTLRTLLAATLMLGAVSAGPQVVSAESHTATTTARHHRRVIRVYDPVYHDYHYWNSSERRAYQEYLRTRRHRYVTYQRQRAAERAAYWHWRHERLEHRR
jgi:hypothetical protein